MVDRKGYLEEVRGGLLPYRDGERNRSSRPRDQMGLSELANARLIKLSLSAVGGQSVWDPSRVPDESVLVAYLLDELPAQDVGRIEGRVRGNLAALQTLKDLKEMIFKESALHERDDRVAALPKLAFDKLQRVQIGLLKVLVSYDGLIFKYDPEAVRKSKQIGTLSILQRADYARSVKHSSRHYSVRKSGSARDLPDRESDYGLEGFDRLLKQIEKETDSLAFAEKQLVRRIEAFRRELRGTRGTEAKIATLLRSQVMEALDRIRSDNRNLAHEIDRLENLVSGIQEKEMPDTPAAVQDMLYESMQDMSYFPEPAASEPGPQGAAGDRIRRVVVPVDGIALDFSEKPGSRYSAQACVVLVSALDISLRTPIEEMDLTLVRIGGRGFQSVRTDEQGRGTLTLEEGESVLLIQRDITFELDIELES